METAYKQEENSDRDFVDSTTGFQYITFSIGEEEYGVDITLVQEIIRYVKPTMVYNSDPVIKGVTNFRGRVIPVIDMRRKFNLPEKEYDSYTVVVVIEVDGKTMGLLVDRVLDITSFTEETLQAVDQEFAEEVKTQYLSYMGKADNRIVMILEPTKILRSDE